jgi:hypothetical protein
MVLAGNDARILARARAEFDAAQQGLSRVMGDKLMADRFGGVAAANEASELLELVDETHAVFQLMLAAAQRIEALENKYELPNNKLTVTDRVTGLAQGDVAVDWQITDGRIDFLPAQCAGCSNKLAAAIVPYCSSCCREGVPAGAVVARRSR